MSAGDQEQRHRDPEWLREKHHEEGLKQSEMAELAGVCQTTISKMMGRFDIETRWNRDREQYDWRRIPEEDLLRDVRRVAEQAGREPVQLDYRVHGEYTVNTLRNRFGSWPEARRLALGDDG